MNINLGVSSSPTTPPSSSTNVSLYNPGRRPLTRRSQSGCRPTPGHLTRPGSAGDSATFARRPPARPARRNPANLDRDGRQDRRTAGPPSDTTPGNTAKRARSRQEPQRKEVKRQVKRHVINLAQTDLDNLRGARKDVSHCGLPPSYGEQSPSDPYRLAPTRRCPHVKIV